MAQQAPAHDDESVETAIDAPRSLREYIKTTVINTVPPLVVYYALRAFGTTPYLALAGAIIAAVGQGILTAVRKRKFEPVNGLVILGAACSLAIAFTTKNPRVVQVIELIPASLFVWSCLVSGLLRKPTSKR
ncbi:MAG: VC0807 family protein, partial [Mycobacterium sp.]